MTMLRVAATFPSQFRHLLDVNHPDAMTAFQSPTLSKGRAAAAFAGFTLAEILVALALMAVLAAVLLPTVAGQILKGDAGKTVSDLQAVRSGSEQFLADIHRYPGKYSDLTKAITTAVATHKDILSNAYK